MKRLLEREGQRRLFCPSLDRNDYRCMTSRYSGYFGWGDEVDEELYRDALDRHDFEPVCNDGEETFLICAACDVDLWIPDPSPCP